MKIQLVNICKAFGDQVVLDSLNLTVEPHRITVIIGESGGGKSVLLKHIIGLIRPDAGSVYIDDVEISALNERQLNDVRKNFGMLFQEAALFDSMTVGENVAFPIREHTRLTKEEINIIVEEKLRQVGLKKVTGKMPAELSGGMRKRVGLARALALNPKIILFDEPTTGLDPIRRDDIDRLIVKTQQHTRATCLVISHDIDSTFKIAHKVAMLYDGRIIEYGPPEKIKNSENPVVKNFIEGKSSSEQ
ncbi:MAG: ABC transporter ATP-binding protein [Deltaproteobacteria bacterium]|nr:MAG: ABC transporter ATP-binding protein [Deltaproteobacteria bacterium]